MGEKQLRSAKETTAQFSSSIVSLAAEFQRNGWSAEVYPLRSTLSMRIGSTPVVVRDERRQKGDRLCVEYEERGRPAGPFRTGPKTMWLHLLANGTAAYPGWWMRREVEWRREYRSTWDARVGDSGGRAILVPVLSCLMRPGEPFHMTYGDPFDSAVPAFEAVVSRVAPPKGGAG